MFGRRTVNDQLEQIIFERSPFRTGDYEVPQLLTERRISALEKRIEALNKAILSLRDYLNVEFEETPAEPAKLVCKPKKSNKK